MIFGALIVGWIFELIRTAWIGDDAVITLRTVMNFVHGYGPVFNVYERVQAYTHPLWFFLISAVTFVLGNPFYSVLLLSAAFSLGTLVLTFRHAARSVALGRGVALGTLVVLAMMFSKAYVEYSTSGLENPLSNFLAVSFVLFSIRFQESPTFAKASAMFGFCSVFYLCRPDLFLLGLPTALVMTLSAKPRARRWVASALLGALPLLLWTLFSLYYYGFPFPNTAYAKLGLGLERMDVIRQGVMYLMDSVGRDPLTMGTIVGGTLLAFRSGRLEKSLVAGVTLYLLYVVYVGGDFMSGRFLTVPFVVSLVLLARTDFSPMQLRVLGVTGALLAIPAVSSTWLSNQDFSGDNTRVSAVTDERGFYYSRKKGFLTGARKHYRVEDWSLAERTVSKRRMLGYEGFKDGPSVHVVDPIGLSDPLLARLPPVTTEFWTPGHPTHQIPTDYMESVLKGENLLYDPATHALYEEIRLITRGDLNDRERWKAIWRMNFGSHDFGLDERRYRQGYVASTSTPVEVGVSEMQRHVDDGSPWNGEGNRIFYFSLLITLERSRAFSTFEISVDGNDSYSVQTRHNGEFVEIAAIEASGGSEMIGHRIQLASPVLATDTVRILPTTQNGWHSVGYFRILE